MPRDMARTSVRAFFLSFVPGCVISTFTSVGRMLRIDCGSATYNPQGSDGCLLLTSAVAGGSHMKRIWSVLLGGAVTMALAIPAVAKDHGRGDRDRGHERHETRFSDHDRDRRGWDHGKKTGWHGSSVPPGEARRHREHEREEWARRHRHHHRDYRRDSYYRDRRPVTPLQRPVTQPGHGPVPVPGAGPTTTASTPKPSGRGPIVVPR